MALISKRRTRTPADPVVWSSVSAPGQPLTAAATTVPPEKWGKIGKTNKRQDWQADAWDMMRQVGELRFAVNWKKALVSRFRLVASDLDPDTGLPTGETQNQAALDVVKRIAGGTAGQAQLLGRFAVLLTVIGEGYLAVIYPEGDEEQWHILSPDEIKAKSGSATEIQLPNGTMYTLNPDTDTLSRIWEPDSQKTWEADSAVRSALPILREIVRMGQNIEGAGKSRQAGNGILVLPEEISMPRAVAPTAAPDPDAPNLPPPPPPVAQYVTSEDIRVALQAAMSVAIQDPASAEALVPIILQTKGDWIDKIRHLRLDSEVTAQSVETREKAIRRLALALDMPAEILTGAGDLNHWNMYAVEDQAVRWHSAPLLETICDGLTEHLLRPMLERADVDPATVVVWYDQSDVEADVDHDLHVKEAFDRGLVHSEAYLREIGLSPEGDGYDLTGMAGWALWATDQVRKDPKLLPMLAPLLQATLPELPAPNPAPPEELPAGDEGTNRGLPDSRSQAVMLRMCLTQAMVLAGKRRRTRANYTELRSTPVAATHLKLGPCGGDTAKLIEGWDDIVDDAACAAAGVDLGRLRQVVTEEACRALRDGAPVTVSEVQVRAVTR